MLVLLGCIQIVVCSGCGNNCVTDFIIICNIVVLNEVYVYGLIELLESRETAASDSYRESGECSGYI